MRIDEILTTQNIQDYVNAIPETPFFLSPLFPARNGKELGKKFEFIQDLGEGLVTAARYTPLDAATDVDGREALEFGEASFDFIKRERVIDEQDLMILSFPRTSAEAQLAIDRIYNDAVAMRLACETKVEATHAAVAFEGVLDVNENGYTNKIDFGMPKTHKASWDWSGGSKSKLTLIREACDLVEEDTNGIRPARAFLSRPLFQQLLSDEELRQIILGTDKKAGILTAKQLNDYFAEQDLPSFYVFQKYWKEWDATKAVGVRKPYMPKDKILFLPDTPIGETVYGITPEEANMMRKEVDVSNIGNICMQIGEMHDPEGYYVKASCRYSVVLTKPKHTFVATIQGA